MKILFATRNQGQLVELRALLGQTFAEAPPEQKNALGHRGRAMRALAGYPHERYASR